MTGRVVVVGSVNHDLVLQVPRLPAPGVTLHAHHVDEGTGGKGANQAVAAAASGAPTLLVGAVGAHDAGPRIRAELADRGVDVRGVRLADAPTGRAVVTVDDDGENCIVLAAGANGHVHADDVIAGLADLGPGDVVVLQNEIPPATTAAAALQGRTRGARVVWNAAPAPVDPVELPGDIDLLVVNEGELAVVAGHLGVVAAAAPALVAAVQETLGADVVCTLGGAGAIYAIGAERGAVAAPPVQVVDTTGAGDTFVGYLCGEWAAGTGSVRDRIELATAAASLAVTRPGAAAAIPARAAVPGSRDPQRVASREGTTG